MASEQGGGMPAGIAQPQFEACFQDLKNFISAEIKEVKGMVKDCIEKYDQLDKKMHIIAKSLSEAVLKVDNRVVELAEDVKLNSERQDETEEKIHKLDNEVVMLQFRSMEFAIRLRGLKENQREDLRKVCGDALATIMKIDPEEVYSKMDKIYRANSRVAFLRQLPRDVVIYFTDRSFRNDVLQKSYYAVIYVEGAQIGVFKELPPSMLRSRREFGFLVTELRRRNIQYRWDVPTGIILRYDGVRHRLNTLEKAKEFYETLMRASTTSPSAAIPERSLQEDVSGPLSSTRLEDVSKTVIEGAVAMPMIKPDEQRVTRSTTRQMLEAQKQGKSQRVKGEQGKKQAEAVGGTISKVTSLGQDLEQMFSVLQSEGDNA